MQKFLNVIMISIIIFFIINIYKHYSSSRNISAKNLNRLNIDEIFKEKIKNLPVLANDTNNVIAFNDSFNDEINYSKKRSFWELLKNK